MLFIYTTRCSLITHGFQALTGAADIMSTRADWTKFGLLDSFFSPHFHGSGECLVLACGSLAGLELIEVPSANVQAALVLVHASAEVVDVVGAGTLGCGLRVVGLALLQLLLALYRGSRRSRGAAAEETTDCVSDGRADGNAAKDESGQIYAPSCPSA